MSSFAALCLTLLVLLVPAGHAEDIAPSAVSPQTAATADQAYRLFPGDLLAFRVFDHEDLDLDLRVPASGTTTMPLIGDIGDLAGRALVEVQRDIRQRLAKDYLVDPVVTLMVLEYGPRQAVVMGAVEERRHSTKPPLYSTTAIQAVGQAGGFAEMPIAYRRWCYGPKAMAACSPFPYPPTMRPWKWAKTKCCNMGTW